MYLLETPPIVVFTFIIFDRYVSLGKANEKVIKPEDYISMYTYLKHSNMYWTSLVLPYFTAYFIIDNKTAMEFVIFLLSWIVTCYQIESNLVKYNINPDEFMKIAIICIHRWTASSLCASCVAFSKKNFLPPRSLMYSSRKCDVLKRLTIMFRYT